MTEGDAAPDFFLIFLKAETLTGFGCFSEASFSSGKRPVTANERFCEILRTNLLAVPTQGPAVRDPLTRWIFPASLRSRGPGSPGAPRGRGRPRRGHGVGPVGPKAGLPRARSRAGPWAVRDHRKLLGCSRPLGAPPPPLYGKTVSFGPRSGEPLASPCPSQRRAWVAVPPSLGPPACP